MTDQTRPATSSAAVKWHAVLAFVAGIVSLLLFLSVFTVFSAGPEVLGAAVVCGLAAVVFGIVALRRRSSKALAITGIVTGGFTLLVGTALLIFVLLWIGAVPE